MVAADGECASCGFSPGRAHQPDASFHKQNRSNLGLKTNLQIKCDAWSLLIGVG